MRILLNLFSITFSHIQEHPPQCSTTQIIRAPTALHQRVKLFDEAINCSACIEAGRRAEESSMGRRKALSELSQNTTRKPRDSKEWQRRKRAPRTHFGCSICKIPFCRKDDCWLPYIERLNSKD